MFGPGLTSNKNPSVDSYSRRHDQQRDYFGYRNNYGRKSGFGSSNRKRESYDKYRPSNRQKSNSNIDTSSWSERRLSQGKGGTTSSLFSDRSRERSEYRPSRDKDDGNAPSKIDDRRLGSRSHDREIGRDQGHSRDHKDIGKGKDRYSEKQRSSHSLELRRSQSEAFLSNEIVSSQHRLSDPSPSVLQSQRPSVKDDSVLKSDSKIDQSVIKKEHASHVSEIKNERLLHLFDDDDEPNKQDVVDEEKSSIKNTNSLKSKETNEISEEKGSISSEANQNLSTSPHDERHYDEHDEHENSELDSEAETVITNEPISTDKAKKYLRKSGPDSERRRLKSKIIYSDNESDSDDAYPPKSVDDLKSSSYSSTLDNSVSLKPRDNSESNKTLNAKDHEKSSSTPVPDADHEEYFEDDAERVIKLEKQHLSRTESTQSSKPSKSYKIKRDSTGRSLLQRACKKGDLEAVKNLISRGADANESDFGGFTCLHEAALAGHTEIVKFLIENGADVNKQALEAGDSETPLMDAAENKHVETVKVLLANGADPNITNVDGFSALTKLYHLQAEEENYDEVIGLLSAAANKTLNPTGFSMSTRKIIEDPNEGYFNDLVKKKTPLSTIYKYVAQGLKEAAAEDFILHGYSLLKKPDILILAARHGHTELVDILLGLNPGSFDINMKNKVGVSILLASVGRGNYDVVKLLLSRGANPLIKRDHDNLNALQIAKHSAQHDPREVFLIEKHLHGETELKAPTEPPSSPTPDKEAEKVKLKNEDVEMKEPEVEVPHSPSPVPKKSHSRRGSEDSLNKRRRNLEDDSTKLLKKRKGAVEAAVEESSLSGKGTKEVEEKLLKSPSGEAKEKTPDADQKPKMNRTESQAPLHSVPTKAQEEQRLKAQEEAKIWQEKVQAKKRARREMFLQAEKEKERKRKEEEERRLEQEKLAKLRAQEEADRKAEEAERIAKDLESKRIKLEIDLIMAKYPIGLRQFVFGQALSNQERLRYCPLYVFDIANKNYVIDLQISLLLATSVSDLHKHCQESGSNEKKLLDSESKAKVWPLFFPMIGIGRNQSVEPDGRQKFMALQLAYIPYEDAASFVKKKDQQLHEDVWVSKREAKVSLAHFPVLRDRFQEPETPQHKRDHEKHDSLGFIPPKWKLRQDVIRTIKSAQTPLW